MIGQRLAPAHNRGKQEGSNKQTVAVTVRVRVHSFAEYFSSRCVA